MKFTKAIGAASFLTIGLGDLISFESECLNSNERYAVVVDDNGDTIPPFFECETFFGTGCNTFDENFLARITNRDEFDIARGLLENTPEVTPFLPQGAAVFIGVTAKPPTQGGTSVRKFSFHDNFPDRDYINFQRGEEPWDEGEPNDGDGEEYCVR